MSTKSGLSIQVKLLILLVSLPVVFLGLYLALVFNLFEKDKIAYIFDSSMAVTKTVASQIRAETNVAVNQLRPVLEGFSSEAKSFDEIGKNIFTINESLALLQVYENQNGQFLKMAQLSKDDGVKDDFTYATQLLSAIDQSSIVMDLSKENDLIWFGIKHINETTKAELYILSLIKSDSILDVFKGKSVYNKFLIRQSGDIIISPEAKEEKNKKYSFANWSFLPKLKGQNFKEGTLESLSPDGEKWLTSFTQVGISDWFILSNIKRATALSAIDVLLKKSLLFFVALISLAVIISIFTSNKTTLGLLELAQATLEVAKGNFNISLARRSNDEIGMLSDSFNEMAGKISGLMSATAEKARMESELATAKTVQENLFPSDYYHNGMVEISGHYRPASECGGDWWFYNEKEGIVQLWIGDATGHGAPAALITSAAKATVSIISRLSVTSPALALAFLNHAIYENSHCKMCMTFFVAFLNLKTKTLEYANSGHDAPYIFRKNGSEFSKKTMDTLSEANGPRLGDRPNPNYSTAKVQLNEGDVILFYTDGVVEMHGPGGELLGERKFVKLALESLNKSMHLPAVIKSIVDEAELFRKNTPLADDVTFFGMRIKSSGELPTTYAQTQDVIMTVEKAIPRHLLGVLPLVNLNGDFSSSSLANHSVGFYDNLSLGQLIPFLTNIDQGVRHLINVKDGDYFKHVALALKVASNRPAFMSDPIAEILEVFSRNLTAPFVTGTYSHEWNLDEGDQFVWFFHSSDQKFLVLEDLERRLDKIPRIVRIKHDIKLLVDELFTNAIFNAPSVVINGKRKKVGRQGRVFSKRAAGVFVKIDISGNKVIVGCVDQFGSLSPSEIVSRLNITYDLGLDKGMDMNSYGGSGIGVRLMLDRSDSVFLIVNKAVETCVVFTLPININRASEEIRKNVHIVVN